MPRGSLEHAAAARTPIGISMHRASRWRALVHSPPGAEGIPGDQGALGWWLWRGPFSGGIGP